MIQSATTITTTMTTLIITIINNATLADRAKAHTFCSPLSGVPAAIAFAERLMTPMNPPITINPTTTPSPGAITVMLQTIADIVTNNKSVERPN